MENEKFQHAPADGGQVGVEEKAPWEKKLIKLLKRLEYDDRIIKKALDILDRESFVMFEFTADGYVIVKSEYTSAPSGLAIIRASDAIVVIVQTADGDYVYCLRI